MPHKDGTTIPATMWWFHEEASGHKRLRTIRIHNRLGVPTIGLCVSMMCVAGTRVSKNVIGTTQKRTVADTISLHAFWFQHSAWWTGLHTELTKIRYNSYRPSSHSNVIVSCTHRPCTVDVSLWLFRILAPASCSEAFFWVAQLLSLRGSRWYCDSFGYCTNSYGVAEREKNKWCASACVHVWSCTNMFIWVFSLSLSLSIYIYIYIYFFFWRIQPLELFL